MLTFLITFGIMFAAIALIAIKIILVPGGEFHGTCATTSEFRKREGGACPVCGQSADQPCPNAGESESADERV